MKLAKLDDSLRVALMSAVEQGRKEYVLTIILGEPDDEQEYPFSIALSDSEEALADPFSQHISSDNVRLFRQVSQAAPLCGIVCHVANYPEDEVANTLLAFLREAVALSLPSPARGTPIWTTSAIGTDATAKTK